LLLSVWNNRCTRHRAGGFDLLRNSHALQVWAADAHVAVKILKDATRELQYAVVVPS
jgi:hypothetical protein